MHPLVREIDYLEAAAVLQAFSKCANVCFLDSAKQDNALGRYSYIVAEPFELISAKDATLNQKTLEIDPLTWLKTKLSAFELNPSKNCPPFQGGAVGYFGYDLLHHLEAIPKPKQDIIAMPDMLLGLYDCVVSFDHAKRKTWLISTGLPEKDAQQRAQKAKARMHWLESIIANVKPGLNDNIHLPSTSVRSNFSKLDYYQAIQKTIDYIYAGDIFQANITQCFSAQRPKSLSSIQLYQALRRTNPAPFSAYLHFDKDNLSIASASPERFIQLQNGNIETRPIKGTRPRGNTLQQDKQLANELLNSEKDRAENIMIVDMLRNDLSKVCDADSVNVTKLCNLESFETVHHLVSEITAKLKEQHDAIDLLKATFPGGSITGAPKVRAMEIISEIEQQARGAYCGAIGYIGFDGNMDTSIVIRTFILKQDKLFFQAGGGIVADSNPKEEYQESLTKAKALRSLLETTKEETVDFID